MYICTIINIIIIITLEKQIAGPDPKAGSTAEKRAGGL